MAEAILEMHHHPTHIDFCHCRQRPMQARPVEILAGPAQAFHQYLGEISQRTFADIVAQLGVCRPSGARIVRSQCLPRMLTRPPH